MSDRIVSIQETDHCARSTSNKVFPHAKQYPLSSAVSSQGPPLNLHQRKTSLRANFNSGNHFTKAHPSLTTQIHYFPHYFPPPCPTVGCTVGQRNTTNQLPSRRELFLEKVTKGARSSHLKKRDGGGSGVRGEGVGKSSSSSPPREQRNNETPCQESARFIDKRAQGGREGGATRENIVLPYPCAAVYRFSTSIKYCDSARRRRLLDGINLRSVERGESRGPWRGRTRGEKERGLGGRGNGRGDIRGCVWNSFSNTNSFDPNHSNKFNCG